MKYRYENIVIFESYGLYHADYMDGGKRYAIHRAACRTKRAAYEYAKEQIDYMNRRDAE